VAAAGAILLAAVTFASPVATGISAVLRAVTDVVEAVTMVISDDAGGRCE
jgi:hypothetical protein